MNTNINKNNINNNGNKNNINYKLMGLHNLDRRYFFQIFHQGNENNSMRH